MRVLSACLLLLYILSFAASLNLPEFYREGLLLFIIEICVCFTYALLKCLSLKKVKNKISFFLFFTVSIYLAYEISSALSFQLNKSKLLFLILVKILNFSNIIANAFNELLLGMFLTVIPLILTISFFIFIQYLLHKNNYFIENNKF